ncbi:MAG: DUF4340 domain-containing protein [Ruminococcus sp.]|nr:DUF4340 domain-containing protein [Ruminococcus sp.]
MENKEPEVIIEDKDYDSLLDKFENPTTSKPPKKKKSTGIKALIIAILCAVVLGTVVCLLIFVPQSSEITDSAKDGEAVKTGLNDKKEWQANVKTDKKGKINTNAGGQFTEKVPADIKTIELENNGGKLSIKSYTPTKKTKETDPETGDPVEKSEATEYTVVGYEDMALQSGVADEIASACSTLEFTKIVDKNGSSHLSDYGLDKPKAIAKVTYTDNTTATIKVGNAAPQNLGTYVMFGSGMEVFLCNSDSTKALLFTLCDLASLTINEAASDNDKNEFKYVTVNGVTMKPSKYTDQIENKYVLDDGSFADENEASLVSGAIRGLYATGVAAVNPTAAQISDFGLKNPKASIKADYPDIDVELIASKADKKGDCYLMEKDGKIVYKIASTSLPWLNTNREKLTDKYILHVKLSGLKGMQVESNGKKYDFDVKTTVTKTTDSEGEESESTNTVTKYMGNEIDEGYFETFLNNVSMLKYEKGKIKNSGTNCPLKIKYTYEKNRPADTLAFTKSGNQYVAILNGKAIGFVYRSYVEKLIDQPGKVAVDKEVKSFW